MSFKNKLYTVVFAVTIICSLSNLQANATPLYFNDFQNKQAGSEWSSTRIDTVPNDELPWGTFLGQFGGSDSVRLSLDGNAKGLVTLSFDTYFIRSWDGEGTDYGKDYFNVGVVNGPTLLNETFSNGNPAGQSYVGNGIQAPAYLNSGNTSMTGSKDQFSLGYKFNDGILHTNLNMDSVYHFTFSFVNTTDNLDVIFAGINLQNENVNGPNGEIYLDESWGLDNVRVDVAAVPEPSSLLLLTGGALGLAALRSRRRAKKA